MHLLEYDEQRLLVNAVTENGYMFSWLVHKDHSKRSLMFDKKIHNGSIEALSIRKKAGTIRGVCCSSDCSFSVVEFEKDNLN